MKTKEQKIRSRFPIILETIDRIHPYKTAMMLSETKFYKYILPILTGRFPCFPNDV